MPGQFYATPSWSGYLDAQRNSLPKLQEIENDISDRVVRFLGCNPGNMQLQGTNTYLVGTGRTRILIDTGEGCPSWARNVTGYLDDYDISISHILLTHCHKDHTGGVADLLAYDSTISVFKHLPEAGQRDIADGQIFRVEGATLRAVHTPGHSSDHTCFLLEEDHALFTGDNILGHGFSVAEDLEAYTTSLRLMAGLKCATGYPGHGQVIPDLPHTTAKYLAQRVSRERQIFGALTRQASYSSSASSVSSRPTSAGGDASDESFDGDFSIDASPGLSIAEIGNIIYGDVSRDCATFDLAMVPLLSQVLQMLLDRGSISYQLSGPEKTRRWFATVQIV